MSLYGYLLCRECKQIFWLGKAVCAVPASQKIDHFSAETSHIEGVDEKRLRNMTLWKMMAEHCGHEMVVVLEGTPLYERYVGSDDVTEIGGDRAGDVSLSSYVSGWKGMDFV